MHLAQLMHSWSPTWRTSILQLRTQAPQPLQRFSSTLTLMREDLQHCKIARVLGVGEEADGALKSACRTDVFAKARNCQVVAHPVPHGNCDDKYREDHIFEIGESACHAALFDLGSRDLVQELLDKAQGAQPPRDSPKIMIMPSTYHPAR